MELVLANNRRLLKNDCAKFWNFFEYLKKKYFFLNDHRDPGGWERWFLMWGRCSLQDIIRHTPRVFSEIFDEQIGELVGHFVVSRWIGPGLAWVEQCLRNAGAIGRHAHPKNGMRGIAGEVEVAIEGGGDHGSGVGKIDAAAFAEAAARPSGVDHPHFDFIAGHLFTEQGCIAAGVQGEEGGAEARAEGRFGLGDACLCTGDLRGIAGDELVHGLAWCEPGYGRQDAIGVTGQEEDIFWGGADGGFEGVGNKAEGIGDAGVLRDGAVVEIDAVGARKKGGILYEGTGPDGVEDAGFF